MKPDLDICPESRTIKRRFINGKIIRARIRSPFRSPRPAAPTTRKVRANASPPSDAKDASYLNEALGYRECLETCANMIKDISHKGFFKKLTTIVALEMVYSLDIKGTRKKCLQVAASSCMIAYKYCETQDAFPRLKLDDLVGWSSNCISRKEIIQMESHILNGLNYYIPHPDLNTFVDDAPVASDQSTRKKGLLNLKNTPYYRTPQ